MEWFASWFDSPYYHILYQNRDRAEAQNFIAKLADFLPITHADTVLDLACGKGRHSLELAKYAKEVWGLDLSPHSIEYAHNSAQNIENVHFVSGDMRHFDLDIHFQKVLNLFTSFGYFETLDENNAVIASVAKHQEVGDLFLIDYFNAEAVRSKGDEHSVVEREGIVFTLQKKVEQQHVLKNIEVRDGNKKYHFQEKVQLFDLETLRRLLAQNGYEIQSIFGNYRLEPYTDIAPRMILLSQKISR